jgi:anti-sigma factor ChrR (cupin superfamily)
MKAPNNNEADDSLGEQAALHSAGALPESEARAFAERVSRDATARQEATMFASVVEALAQAVPRIPQPSPDLKARILLQAEQSRIRKAAVAKIKQLLPVSDDSGFSFLKGAASSGWLPLGVRGAFVKLLSYDESSSHAVVLGRLDAGARYPSHSHLHGEDIFMVSGDLHLGAEVLHAGDFHHADAGSTHGVNWSEHGCVLMAVLSKEDLLAQLAPPAVAAPA